MQTTFPNEIFWMKMFEFLKFLEVQLTIFQHWFRKWLGAQQATTHYLNQWWPSSTANICVTRPQWVNMGSYIMWHLIPRSRKLIVKEESPAPDLSSFAFFSFVTSPSRRRMRVFLNYLMLGMRWANIAVSNDIHIQWLLSCQLQRSMCVTRLKLALHEFGLVPFAILRCG